METTERDLRDLRRRLERLERLVVQAVCAAAALALLVGSVIDYVPVAEGVEDKDKDEDLSRLLVVGFKALTYRDDEGDVEGFALAAGIGFLGLLLVAAVVLWVLLVIASGAASERTGRVLGVAITLLLVGTAVAGLFALIGLGDDDYDVGWGVVVFAAGGLTCLLLLRSELREWWDPTRGR